MAIVFIVIQYSDNASYFSGSSEVIWNVTFKELDKHTCFQAFSVFSFGLSNAMLVFWVVNQYRGIAFSNKRYSQMGFIYIFVVFYFTALGVIDIFLANLNLKNTNLTQSHDYYIWKWIFRAIYFFQQLTQLSYMFWFLRKLIFREELRLLLQNNK